MPPPLRGLQHDCLAEVEGLCSDECPYSSVCDWFISFQNWFLCGSQFHVFPAVLLQLWCKEVSVSTGPKVQNVQQLWSSVTTRESYSSEVCSFVVSLQSVSHVDSYVALALLILLLQDNLIIFCLVVVACCWSANFTYTVLHGKFWTVFKLCNFFKYSVFILFAGN